MREDFELYLGARRVARGTEFAMKELAGRTTLLPGTTFKVTDADGNTVYERHKEGLTRQTAC